jgi:hypothetical protein
MVRNKTRPPLFDCRRREGMVRSTSIDQRRDCCRPRRSHLHASRGGLTARLFERHRSRPTSCDHTSRVPPGAPNIPLHPASSFSLLPVEHRVIPSTLLCDGPVEGRQTIDRWHSELFARRAAGSLKPQLGTGHLSRAAGALSAGGFSSPASPSNVRNE